MTQLPDHLTSERWLAQFLSSAEARKGGIVKRQIRDVERLVGRAAFIAAVERRGFQAVENGRHFIVFCNNDPIRRVHSAPRESAFERAS
ncbi:MAG: N-(5'-phosphoribosyl)anthranilate isomerase [Maritimibacter sp.]|nr:N-(5'-phosphoribosyl)anthranilate isomerase [Maritimibacter sp.]